jgi:uncharacterized protein YjbI with pentapeptide repeats
MRWTGTLKGYAIKPDSDLTRANLTDANLTNVDLSGADLSSTT